MSNEEFGEPQYEDPIQSLMLRLKFAVIMKQKPEVYWHSLEDNEIPDKLYRAYPLDQEAEEMDVLNIGHIPAWQLMEIFNSWLIIQSRFTDDDDIELKAFFMEDGQPVKTTKAEVELGSVEDQTIPETFDKFRRELEQLDRRELPHASLQDYAELGEAAYYLKDFMQDFAEEDRLRRITMTRTEQLLERARKFGNSLATQVEKTKTTEYWLVEADFGLMYVAKNADPVLAAAIVDEHLEAETGHGLLAFRTQPLEDEHVTPLREVFGDNKELIRLIPCSRLPWPENTNDMTDEQRAAFDRLK